MRGRYFRRSDKRKIAEAFHIAHVDDIVILPWDYNVAPTTHQPVIRNNRETGERELVMMRWELAGCQNKAALCILPQGRGALGIRWPVGSMERPR
jgi:putative SOS response-associated peptidase YedK